MKRVLLTFSLLTSLLSINAQNTSVEKSVFGAQVGLLGVFAHNEAKLTNSIALRSEIGLDVGWYINTVSDKSLFIGAIALTLEPRWYYNLNRRVSKNKRIDGNTGNFISLKTTYHPDIILFSTENNINLISDLSIIPTYGIRRSLGKHFNYEAAFGIGYINYFDEENSNIDTSADVGVNLHLRIGYRF